MPLVKLPHMLRSIRRVMPTRRVEVIRGLPRAAKVILCILVSLAQVWGLATEISISQLKNYCVGASDELGGVRHIMSLIGMLVDSGLLITGNSGHFDPYDLNSKFKLGVQLDDVAVALEENVLMKAC